MAYLNFKPGSEVEITSPVHCLRGTLFPGRVIAPSSDRRDKYLVEYKTLVTEKDGSSAPCREEVEVGLLRPTPRAETKHEFKCDDVVDAFFNGGWWEGVVMKELNNSRYMVYFRCVKQQYRFDASELRIHREWVKGRWVPPFDEEDEDKEDDAVEAISSMEERPSTSKYSESEGFFTRGTLVEVRSDEDGLEGAWFTATISSKAKKDKFFVVYQSLRAEDNNSEYLREEVDASHLRPYPPESFVVGRYDWKARVDALYNEGWWEGVVVKVLSGLQYKVYFEGTEDSMVFHHSELRPHQDWINGEWVTPSRAP